MNGFLKTLGVTLGALLVLFLGVALCLGLLFGSMGRTTELERVPSPDGSRTAILIREDHGATGGATVVVVEQAGWRTEIYRGPWAESFDMELAWDGSDRLLLNGQLYPLQ